MMLAGMGICQFQPDFNRLQLKHTALRMLCVENGIDSSAVLFCKQEFLLASIKNQYSQVNLYNDSGFLIEPKTKDGFIEMSQLEFVFENLKQFKPQHCDSSKSIDLEKENWIVGNGFSFQNSFVIVCYWSARKFLQEQFFRMQELQKLKEHFSHISIRLVFINQDYIP
jgi:hypothetical protein